MSDIAVWLLCLLAFVTAMAAAQCAQSLMVIRAQLGEMLGLARRAEADRATMARLLADIEKINRR